MEHTGIIQTAIYSTAIYCRLSRDDGQAGDSASIQTQKMMLEKYCHEQGFPIYGVYVDDGYSGLNFDRTDFQRLLTDIDNGRINLVITKDLSRLGRDYIQTGYYTDIYFSKKKVRYIAVSDGVDTNRDDNDIAPFKNILNDMYAKDISRKTKTAKRQRAYSGYYIAAQAPYGYKVNPENKHQLIVDDEPAEVVKEMFGLALAGNSTMRITKILTERKVMTPSAYKLKNGDTKFTRQVERNGAYKWCNVSVQKILRDMVYMGDMENHKYEYPNYKTEQRVRVPKEQHIIVENTHEAIISREDYNRVQSLVKMRHKPKKHDFDNVFKSIVFCSECGGRFTIDVKQRPYGHQNLLLCRRHFTEPQRCQHYNFIHYDKLYEAVLKQLRQVAKSIETGGLTRSIQQQALKRGKGNKLEADKAKIESRLVALSKITKKLYEDNACDLLDMESYHRMLKEYQEEQKQLIQRLNAIQTERNKKGENAENLQKLSDAIKAYLNIDKLTANMLNQLIERIEVGYPETVNGERQQEINIIYRFVGTTI
jgi:DNA invertase Pin-like site-specific DNA recombinase